MKEKENITYNDILNLWLDSKNNLKQQSLIHYENLIQHYLKNTIGIINIKQLKKEDIENLFHKLKETNIAISTKKTLIYIIRSSLNYSYNNQYSEYIDIKNIIFKLPNKTIFVLSKEEQNRLENNLKQKPNIRKICILLCLYTGLRIGEVCGLKWEDIDFSNQSLTIKRTIERIKNKDKTIKTKTILIESTPKSDTSNRIIPIPDFLILLLKQFKNNDSYFLLSNKEKKYDPRLLESFYSRILKISQINPNKFHTLRHTFATRCIESKMDVKTLSEILGHSQVETTLKLYVHPSYEHKKSSLENLVKFMKNDR